MRASALACASAAVLATLEKEDAAIAKLSTALGALKTAQELATKAGLIK